MTPPDDPLLALAERCEKAEGRDLDLDHAINDLLGDSDGAPLYTRSIDAAMTLTSESDCWGLSKQERNPGKDYYYQATVMPWQPPGIHEARAATHALALCAASLRARAALRARASTEKQ